MAPVPGKNVTQHFSHPHPLLYHSDPQAYVCHACKTSGSGDRFRCHACVLDIHLYCADCPRQLSSFLHNHPLALMVRKPQPGSHTHNHDRICDVCRESISFGAQLYRCNDCHFYVHPLCTQLPENLLHVIDDNHKLRLQKLSSGTASCAVCKTDCSSLWVYGCDLCKVNIHLKCLRKPYSSRRTESREKPVSPSGSGGSSSRSRGIPHAPPPWAMGQPPSHGGGFQFHGGFPGGPSPHGIGYPWGYPNYYIGHHGPVHFSHNNPSHWPNHGGHAPPSSSTNWGSLFGNTMFSLIGNIAVGSLTDFLFGSIGF